MVMNWQLVGSFVRALVVLILVALGALGYEQGNDGFVIVCWFTAALILTWGRWFGGSYKGLERRIALLEVKVDVLTNIAGERIEALEDRVNIYEETSPT
ncbi:MAG: hypothetical protein ACI9DC_001725 [Gammaproteobacteria bacterium]|jgi:hypothetical protein